MIRWEYQAPYLLGGFEKIMEQLADLGKERWELVQLNPECSDGGSRVFLKRVIVVPDFQIVPDGYDARAGAINYVRKRG